VSECFYHYPSSILHSFVHSFIYSFIHSFSPSLYITSILIFFPRILFLHISISYNLQSVITSSFPSYPSFAYSFLPPFSQPCPSLTIFFHHILSFTILFHHILSPYSFFHHTLSPYSFTIFFHHILSPYSFTIFFHHILSFTIFFHHVLSFTIFFHLAVFLCGCQRVTVLLH
jgi:hypothetical protein